MNELINEKVDLLIKAAKNNDLKLVDDLIEEGVPVHLMNDNEEYALLEAIYNENIDMIKSLVFAGACTSFANSNDSILHSALYRENQEIIDFLSKIDMYQDWSDNGQDFRAEYNNKDSKNGLIVLSIYLFKNDCWHHKYDDSFKLSELESDKLYEAVYRHTVLQAKKQA